MKNKEIQVSIYGEQAINCQKILAEYASSHPTLYAAVLIHTGDRQYTVAHDGKVTEVKNSDDVTRLFY